MLYLANPCGPKVVQAMRDGHLAYIDTPAQGNKRPDGVTWAAYNGCFSDKWDQVNCWRFLNDKDHDAGTCLFAVAPESAVA